MFFNNLEEVVVKKSKFIDVKYHWLRDKINANEIKLEYRRTSEMIADILTKPLGKNLFQKHCTDMGVIIRSGGVLDKGHVNSRKTSHVTYASVCRTEN